MVFVKQLIEWQNKEGRNFLKKMTLIVTSGLVFVSLSGCIEDKKPKREVVVFVLDDFMSEKSHGGLVSDVIKKKSFGKCEIISKDVFRTFRGQNSYLEALKGVLRYAESHPEVAIVVNLSLGSYDYNLIEHLLIRELYDKGVIIIAAAGNDNTFKRQYPAAYKETIAVAAASWDKKSDYSNYGEYIDIVASGFGDETFLKRETEGAGLYIGETTYYRIRGGTSFATPRVTGLIAYLLRQRPELKPQQIVKLVKDKAKPLKDDTYYRTGQLGVGEVSFYKTILKEDPLYQRILFYQVISIIVALASILISILITGESALMYVSLIFLAPILLAANFILISIWGLINGSIASSILIVGSTVLFSIKYCFSVGIKEKETGEKQFYLQSGDRIYRL